MKILDRSNLQSTMSNFYFHRFCFIGCLFHPPVFEKLSVVSFLKIFSFKKLFFRSVFDLQKFYFFVSLLGSEKTGCLSL